MHVELPELYPRQREAIYCDERYSLIEASTKTGKTVGVLIWMLDALLTGPGPGGVWTAGARRGMSASGVQWWVAPTYAVARIAFDRAQTMLRDLIAQGIVSVRQSPDLEIEAPSGKLLRFRSAEHPAKTLYGDEVDELVVDEGSRCRKPGVWDALTTVIAPKRAPVRVIGNVVDKHNWFYRLCRVIEEGHPPYDRGWRYTKLTVWDAVDAGILDRAEVEQSRAEAERRGELHIWMRDFEANPEGTGTAWTDEDHTHAIEAVPVGGAKRHVLLIDQGGRMNPAGCVVVAVARQGQSVRCEVVHAARWYGSPVELHAERDRLVRRFAPSRIAFDSYDPSFVDATVRKYGRRAVHVRSTTYEHLSAVRARVRDGDLRIGPEWSDLHDDLDALALDERNGRLVVPEYPVEATVDGEIVRRRSHCDLAVALLRLPPVLGTFEASASRSAGPRGNTPAAPQTGGSDYATTARRSVFG